MFTAREMLKNELLRAEKLPDTVSGKPPDTNSPVLGVMLVIVK